MDKIFRTGHSVDVGDYKLVLNFAAMLYIEQILGKGVIQFIAELEHSMSTGSAKIGDIATFYLACMQEYHPDAKLQDAYQLFNQNPDSLAQIIEVSLVLPEEVGNEQPAKGKKAGVKAKTS